MIIVSVTQVFFTPMSFKKGKKFRHFDTIVNPLAEMMIMADNPHPFSRMKTELIWEGKYDEYGNRRTTDIAGCAMPLQKIETIDEPASCAATRIF
ncbi:MAG: hypothetical protein U9N19_03800 [Thermodesulfobacteriota bacterium]|nr:hypothetical protein [Thermodesulfobacteriota bacterium]